MKIAANVIGWLVGIGLVFFAGSLFYARWEQRRWDRMDVDRKLRHLLPKLRGEENASLLRYFLKKRGGKL